jgi:hypothetical protein
MNSLISRFFILAIFLGTLVALGASAQEKIQFKASEPFVAGESSFPAGTYTLTQQEDDPSAWELSNDSKAYHTFIIVEPVDSITPSTKSEVTFQKYGSTLVLKRIWIAGHNTSYISIASYAEKKAAKTGKPTKVSAPAEKK